MLHVNLAFKYVAIAVMLADANECAERLHLPVSLPIRQRHLQDIFVSPPILNQTGFGGRIDTDQYSFCFSDDRMRFILNIEDKRHGMSLSEYVDSLARQKSVIGTNDAYQLAKSWLQAVDVDVQAMERNKPPKVKQSFTYLGGSIGDPSKKADLPLFIVEWGEFDYRKRPHGPPTILAELSGLDRKLLRLRQDDGSYSRRPPLITNLPALMAITDEEFKSYSSAQRSNLITRFSLIHRRALLRKANDAQRHDSSTNVSSPASPPK